jgi:hypothetical protein
VLPAWAAARVLVVLGWVGAVAWTAIMRHGAQSVAMHQGLFGWDGEFYRGIAEHGYLNEPTEALRFFPLFPLAGRALGAVIGSTDLALLVVANLGALLGAALVRRLAIESGVTTSVATRAAWLLTVAPTGFVFVWAYAEGLFVLLSAAMLLALRRERWWTAALLGFGAGLTRPTGGLLALAALFVAAQGLRACDPRDLPGRLAAVAGPVLGVLSFLWWVGREVGDSQLPIRVQDQLRGGTVNPLVRVAEAAVDLARFEVDGLHFPFAVAMIVLAVVAARRLPGELALYGAATVVVTLAAVNLNSSERYAMGAVPLAVALALVTDDRRWRTLALTVSGAGFVALTSLAWLQVYVP